MSFWMLILYISVAILGFYIGKSIADIFLNPSRTAGLLEVDESKMCKIHKWQDTLLLFKKQANALKLMSKDKRKEVLENLPKTRVCQTCGYVPSENAMLTESHLRQLEQYDLAKGIKAELQKALDAAEEKCFKEACDKWEALKTKPHYTQAIKLGMAAQKKAYTTKTGDSE